MAEPSADVTVSCPHCGGAIKPAAKLCKHCKRSVDSDAIGAAGEPPGALLKRAQDLHFSKRFDAAVAVYEQVVATFSDSAEAATAREQLKNLGRMSAGGAVEHVRRDGRDSTPIPAAVPATPQFPPVLLELRAFLASKKLVDVAKVDQLLASRNADDAAVLIPVLIRQLAVLGHVTQVQAEALVGEFHQRQMMLARGVIEAARARGLVSASHVELALGAYAPMAFGAPIHDHLVGSGLLTREQAEGLHCSAARRGKGVVRVAVASLVIVAIVVVIAIAATRKGKHDDNCWKTGHKECVNQCDSGNPTACDIAGEDLMQGRRSDESGLPIAQDKERAFKYLKQACSIGSHRGCNHVAMSYARGDGVAPDLNRAIEMLDAGCSREERSACSYLANVVRDSGGDLSKVSEQWMAVSKKICENKMASEDNEYYLDKEGQEHTALFDVIACWSISESSIDKVSMDEALKYARMACEGEPGYYRCASDDELRKDISKFMRP